MSDLKIVESVEEIEALIEEFGNLKPEGTVLLTQIYQPNGSHATWSEEWVAGSVGEWEADPSDESDWETAELDSDLPDPSIKLFRHDGAVLHYQSYRWVSAEEVATLLIDTYYGGESIKLDSLPNFAEWLEDKHGLENEETVNLIVATLLRHVADQLTN